MANSNSGCKVDEVNGFFIWVDLNKWVIFPVFLLLGAVICFAGKYYLRYLIFLSGVIEASFLIILICYSTFAQNNEKQWVGWVTLTCSVIIGFMVGFVLMKYEKFGGFCLAAWGGFSTGLLMYNAFLYKIESQVALWCFAVALGILYAVLLLFFFDHILIHATAMIGSFLFIFAIGLVAGHYANPFNIA
jgi:hypothetical protein